MLYDRPLVIGPLPYRCISHPSISPTADHWVILSGRDWGDWEDDRPSNAARSYPRITYYKRTDEALLLEYIEMTVEEFLDKFPVSNRLWFGIINVSFWPSTSRLNLIWLPFWFCTWKPNDFKIWTTSSPDNCFNLDIYRLQLDRNHQRRLFHKSQLTRILPFKVKRHSRA